MKNQQNKIFNSKKSSVKKNDYVDLSGLRPEEQNIINDIIFIIKEMLNEDKTKNMMVVLNYFYHCMLMDESNDENVVYFIRNEYTGLLKIGKTNNLSRRITEIERCFNFLGFDTQKLVIEAISYCPFGINNGKVETFYHNLFKEKRKNGEWFDVSYEELMNTLYCDYIINGVIVAVENITDFPDGAKTICLEEENVEILRKNIENNLVEKLSKELCIFDNIFKFNKKETIPSEKLYNYLIGLKKNDGNLDNKIKHRIEHILEFMD